MIKPNWKNSIVNVSATLDKFLGNTNQISSIPLLEKVLKKGYKNVVYLCLDGLGIYPLTCNLEKDKLLRRNIRKKITSVFPSTTTNATTSLHSATYPAQHGYFGWSLWFEKLNRAVNIYPRQDSYTEEKLQSPLIDKYLEFDYFYDRNSSEYEVLSILPPYVKREKNNAVYHSISELFEKLTDTCNNDKKNFIFAYTGEPDSTMHDYGVNSPEASEIIHNLNDFVENFVKNTKDTCIIITPDHGQTDIKDYVRLYENADLMQSLATVPFLEARAAAFNVKDHEKFLKAVNQYKKIAKLYKTSELIKKNYFGKKQSDRLHMLGDYILIMKDTDKHFVFDENHPVFKGHHTALSKNEMILPLIIIEN